MPEREYPRERKWKIDFELRLMLFALVRVKFLVEKYNVGKGRLSKLGGAMTVEKSNLASSTTSNCTRAFLLSGHLYSNDVLAKANKTYAELSFEKKRGRFTSIFDLFEFFPGVRKKSKQMLLPIRPYFDVCQKTGFVML